MQCTPAIISLPRAPSAREAARSDAVRRLPIQGRSQSKVQRILAAAAQLSDTMALDAITMAAVGKLAGASFSSIYRFFPSKEAIFGAVAAASYERLQRLYDAYFAGAASPSDGDEVIELYVDFARSEPGFRALWVEWAPAQEIGRCPACAGHPAALLADTYIGLKLGQPAAPELKLRLVVAARAATEILRFGFEQKEFPRDQVIAELKHWLEAARPQRD